MFPHLFSFKAAMNPMNPKKRWLAESTQDEEPDADIAEDDERVSDAAEGVGRLTIDLEHGGAEEQLGQLVTSETPPPLPPPPQPLPSASGPPLPPPRSSHIDGIADLGRLQPGQNAHITSETLISRVTSVVPVSEPSSSAGSSPFR